MTSYRLLVLENKFCVTSYRLSVHKNKRFCDFLHIDFTQEFLGLALVGNFKSNFQIMCSVNGYPQSEKKKSLSQRCVCFALLYYYLLAFPLAICEFRSCFRTLVVEH